jgi:hypothetical protein
MMKMEDTKYTKEEIEHLRSRYEYEDGLLNTRIEIVLVFNGLMARAAGLGYNNPSAIALATVTLVINLFWLPCSFQHDSYMARLTRIIKASDQKPLSEKLRFEHQKWKIYGPTFFMSTILPLLLTSGWVLWILKKMA